MHATIHKPKTVAIGAFVIASFGWLGWIVFQSVAFQTPLIHIAWLNALLLLIGSLTAVYMQIVIAWYLYRAWNTRMSDLDISQPQFRGNVRVHWEEFTSMKISNQSTIELHHSEGTVVIATGLYAEPETVMAFVQSKVRHG